MTIIGRREFLVGAAGSFATGVAAALAARELGGQQATNFAPMDQSAYRPTIRPPKPGATPLLNAAERDALEKQLKCQCTCPLDVYTCRTTDFTCPVSPAMHRDVMRLIDGGYDREEILAAFVETFGEVALTSPKKQGFNWAGYFAPGIVLATGALVLTLMLRRWSVAATAATAATATTRRAAASDSAVNGANASPGGEATAEATAEELARLARALREDR